MSRVGAIDCGTNSIRLLIADVTEVHEVITDASADPAHLAALRGAGVEVVVADAG